MQYIWNAEPRSSSLFFRHAYAQSMPRYNITVDDASPLITYSPAGSWHTAKYTNSYNAEHSSTRLASSGGTASFAFNGTGVWLFGTPAAAGSSLSVSIDGKEHNSIAFGTPGDSHTLLFGRAGLSSGSHEVLLMGNGMDVIELDLDYITFETAIGSDDSVLDEEAVDLSMFELVGVGWSTSLGGGVHSHLSTSSAGESASLQFEGDAITLYGATGPSCGRYEVQLDEATRNIYNATRSGIAENQIMFHASKLGSGRHTLRISNALEDPVQHKELAIYGATILGVANPKPDPALQPDHAQKHMSLSRRATSSSGGSKSKAPIIAGVCAAIAVVLLIVGTGLWLWWRRRRLGHRMHHVPVSKLKTFDIDDETPLQKTSLFKSSSASELGVKSTASSIITRTLHLSDNSSDNNIVLAHKISPITSFEPYPAARNSSNFASSSRSTLDIRSGRDRDRDRDRDRGRDKDRGRDRESGGRRQRGGRSRSRNAHDRSPDSDEPDNGLSSERARAKRARRTRERERRGGASSPSNDRRSRKKHKARRDREDRYNNVIRLKPHPPLPKRTGKGRRRSLRGSRILRAGYNIFFAQAGSSNSGSAYAPSTVLTSEISERPTNTLSPVSEVPPPLPSVPSSFSVPSSSSYDYSRAIIANQVDGEDDD